MKLKESTEHHTVSVSLFVAFIRNEKMTWFAPTGWSVEKELKY